MLIRRRSGCLGHVCAVSGAFGPGSRFEVAAASEPHFCGQSDLHSQRCEIGQGTDVEIARGTGKSTIPARLVRRAISLDRSKLPGFYVGERLITQETATATTDVQSRIAGPSCLRSGGHNTWFHD